MGPYAYPGPLGEQVRDAEDLEALLRLVRSFLAGCQVSELELLERATALRACASGNDVREAVIGLGVARATAAAGAEVPAELQRLFTFFTNAATRLANLQIESAARS